MRHVTRYGSFALIGFTAALAACSSGEKAADTTAAAATATPDSAAAAAATAPVGLSAANIASVITLTNEGEIEQGKKAEDKATDAEVKAFAKQMISDHEMMQKGLDSLAKAKNLMPAPPAQADAMKAEESATMAKLDSAAKGAAFDKAYIAAQVMGHQKALDNLKTFSGGAPDPDLKTMIDGAIPKVQAHLDKAQQLQAKVGTP